MFEINYIPVWALVVCFVLIVVGIVIASIGERLDNEITCVIGVTITAVSFAMMLISPISLFGASSNNYNTVAPGGVKMLQATMVDEDDMNDFIADSIDVDKVSMTEDVTMEDVKGGKIFDFTGFKDGAKVTGNVYFKDDTMVIFVDDGSVSGKTINIVLDK